MGLRKPEEYISALREKSKRAEIYVLGERVEDVTKHPFTLPAVKAFEWTYKAPWDPYFYDKEMGVHLAKAYSPFINEEINRFNHIHQSPQDLAIKVKYFRKLSHKAGSCFQRCVGWDAINTISIISYDIDNGTNRRARSRSTSSTSALTTRGSSSSSSTYKRRTSRSPES